MTLQDSIAVINAMPLSDAQKAAIIAQLVLAAPAAPAAPVVDVAAQQAANLASLAAMRPDLVSTGHGSQTAAAQALASAYVAVPPTNNDRLNPPLWAYNNFLAAGYANPTQADGPVERWGSQMAFQGGLGSDWVAAFNVVVAGYAAGTANMNAPLTSSPAQVAINAGTYTPASYTDAQKMLAQFVACQPANVKAATALDAQLGGNGVAQNLRLTALMQMFGAEGTAQLYNPLAAAAMNQLIAGKSADFVLGSLTAQGGANPTAGYAESLAALTPAWFTLAASTIAQYK